MTIVADCELYNHDGTCSSHLEATLFQAIFEIAAVVIVLVAVVAWWGKRKYHVQKPRAMSLPPDLHGEPLASRYVAARVRVVPTGPIVGALRRVRAFVARNPSYVPRRGPLSGATVIEIYEIATNRVLVSYWWVGYYRAAGQVEVINEHAGSQPLDQFLAARNIPRSEAEKPQPTHKRC